MLSFEDYRRMGGGVEDEILYARLSAKAHRLIQRATHDRCDGGLSEAAQAAVDRCAFELIEQFGADAELGGIAQGRDVAAVSNDGVSVSFSASGGATTASAQARAFATIRMWLDGVTGAGGVHLLYAGVDA